MLFTLRKVSTAPLAMSRKVVPKWERWFIEADVSIRNRITGIVLL